MASYDLLFEEKKNFTPHYYYYSLCGAAEKRNKEISKQAAIKAKTSQPDKLHQSITRMNRQHLLIHQVNASVIFCMLTASGRLFHDLCVFSHRYQLLSSYVLSMMKLHRKSRWNMNIIIIFGKLKYFGIFCKHLMDFN